MIGDRQISIFGDWDLDWDLDIFETGIEGVILISFLKGVPNSTGKRELTERSDCCSAGRAVSVIKCVCPSFVLYCVATSYFGFI